MHLAAASPPAAPAVLPPFAAGKGRVGEGCFWLLAFGFWLLAFGFWLLASSLALLPLAGREGQLANHWFAARRTPLRQRKGRGVERGLG